MVNQRKLIQVQGVVQGVGFRPFIYKLAKKHGLNGRVSNTSRGVEIDIEGGKKNITDFISAVKDQPPRLAKIEKITTEDLPAGKYKNFQIATSKSEDDTLTLISPDVSLCRKCKAEILEVNNRRYKYPFTNCTNCGPRFSIIKDLPYDRRQTTMEPFKMCPECRAEYHNPEDRRFHAQPNACPDCGPEVWLTDNEGNEFEVEQPLEESGRLLRQGQIIAVKGLSGFHLICDGTNQQAVVRLRRNKSRPNKPLAVMMDRIETVKEYCQVSKLEADILQGIRKPILLLEKKGSRLPFNIAPNNNSLGVMLPYTPLHCLLFSDQLQILVVTSANQSSLPLEYKNQSALENLREITDYFLLHNREIHLPIDDSVVEVMAGKERIVRRSRGYTPQPIEISELADKDTLAYGAHFKNTFSISKGRLIFLSQHIGDLDNLETYQRFKRVLNHFKEIYEIEPKIIAYDLHPDYPVSKFGQHEVGKKAAVQHHHAHIVSCLAENGVNKRVIGVAFDGTGWGTDNRIWGGEFLLCDYNDFQRVGRLNYVQLPGGDRAVKAPWRMAVSYLFNTYGEELDCYLSDNLAEKELRYIINILKHRINSPQTSSMGRLFAAVSALIGQRESITYQGQAAVELEAVAAKEAMESYAYEIEDRKEGYVINTDKIIRGIVTDLKQGTAKQVIAGRFHATVIGFSLEVCSLLRDRYNINRVALSGGVFQNEIIFTGLYNRLIKAGFEVYTHSRVPCNDGGLSLGQLVIANNQERSQT
ncbi:carbamoyltransferase HypF [Acetohalobium arabaticum]|uniref:Carbamoyltransferase n=1 Tax=Acetohalobium arabaticum (strain ATCC 49924 / DSM 5501 / Z-7288) TaxID=574087 RepID=D9QVE4_ACEAZ|nr:carbamoyltransferase HypF [Acetohalobium arabaticum]ADL12203.1 (NiFe) hydrogenase maturation protein HypF [Acetohalobium arabaticum DSM 5501]